MSVPARAVLERAERRRAQGDPTGGFLCEEHGLLPCEAPLTSLPPSHAIWDDVAARLPDLYRSLMAREALDAMPELPAGREDLPDNYLHRACGLLGMLAHTYVRVRPDPPDHLPDSIEKPWADLCRRLDRPIAALSYDDLIVYNWRWRDPAVQGRRTVEHLALLFPTVGNREEEVFYLSQVEILYEGAPLIGAMARAQEAVADDDGPALEAELAAMADVVARLTHTSFLKIDPNPHSPTHVDPVVWAKTVGPFAVAISDSTHAISGAAAPLFQLLDVFLGRQLYESRVGHEAQSLRPSYPADLRGYLEALGEVSVGEYVSRAGSRRLTGLWHGLAESYLGDRGFLGVHRRKAYAFLEVAFKVGRSVTTGGFTGLFEDQTWEVAHHELELSRQERVAAVGGCPFASARAAATGDLTSPGLVHLRLDVSDAGLRYRPGDRVAIQPRNDPDLVARTLRALRADGATPVRLDGTWRRALAERGADDVPTTMRLGDLLAAGCIRPVSRETAKALLERSQSERLARIVNARAEGSWELWDLLELLAEGGFEPRQLWEADPWEPYSVAKLVPPEAVRLYSIASAMDPDADVAADTVDVLVSELRYETAESDVTRREERSGTTSAFLARLARLAGGLDGAELVGVRVVPAGRFRLPDYPSRPIVLLAGGAGMSAFYGFLAARQQQGATGPALLLLTTRSARHVELHRAKLEAAVRDGGLVFDAEVTAGADRRSAGAGIGTLVARHGPVLLRAMRAGDGASFYVCGPAGFAASALAALERLPEADGGTSAEGRVLVRRMMASGRLQQDVFTNPTIPATDEPRFDASDVALHTDESVGTWTILDGAVYDLTEFAHRHPGGRAILLEVAGRDATSVYRTIEHHVDPEIEAMLPMYRIGAIRRLDFGARGALVVDDRGLSYSLLGDAFRAWVRFLHLVVEVDNAVRHDFSILDAVTVRGDAPDEPTLLKVQLLLEAHQRFRVVYLPSLLGAALSRLWSLTTGFCAPDADVRALDRALAAAASSPAAGAAEAGATDAVARLQQLGGLPERDRSEMLERISSRRRSIQDADLGLLGQLKSTIAAGVRCFERWEGETPDRAGPELVATLTRIPDLVAQFHQQAADALPHARPTAGSH